MKPLPSEDLASIQSLTTELWEEVRGRTIFMTGGSGFFGSWLHESFCHINQALHLNARLIILTRDPERFAATSLHVADDPAVSVWKGDVRTFEFPQQPVDFIIHAAAETRATLVADQPAETYSTIVHGTERVLQYALHTRATKLLFTSSGAVYGSQPRDIPLLPETYEGAPDPLAPASIYGHAKRTAEMLCAIYGRSGNLSCKIARCWAFCGPRLPLDEHFAIGNFIADAMAHRSIEIRGDGTPLRSYLYASDLVVWLWTILFRAPALRPFHVGSSRGISILDLAHQVAVELSPESEIRVGETPQPCVGPSRYVPSTERAQNELGLRETVGLNEMIRRTAAWYGHSESAF
ncbi:NAD-dependent epimerase/dehydratase family protein [Terriglobus albidus]|uniref:NAD-dependent epimerase/dehydratase family protein n=1 Tax=Terriglobus albidus TaxID=1592106 RepID=UPI0021E02347|nr:NAD-dependent epimerase/dehydratase family protein [Terriglobus albidus]